MSGLGEVKDDILVTFNDKLKASDKKIKDLTAELDKYKKGTAGVEAQLKAKETMHSQKIQTLLRSINNLKKELQREKFEKKDNVRIQKIHKLSKDIELMEVGMNALRKLVNSEDSCDAAITDALNKGPKRIRIASREELKIEINKNKSISLRLVEELKRNKIKVPAYAGKSSLNEKETGLREEKGAGGVNADLDHLEAQSQASNNMDLGEDAGESSEQALIA